MSSLLRVSACFAPFAAASLDAYDSRVLSGARQVINMITLICFVLSCYGVTNIVTGGKIFHWLRRLLKPVPIFGYWIQCPMCISVPIGAAWYLLGVRPDFGASFWVSVAAAGMISSASCWMFRVVLHRLGEDEL